MWTEKPVKTFCTLVTFWVMTLTAWAEVPDLSEGIFRERVTHINLGAFFNQLANFRYQVVFLGESHGDKDIKDFLVANADKLHSLGFTHLGLEALSVLDSELIEKWYKGEVDEDEFNKQVISKMTYQESMVGFFDSIKKSKLRIVPTGVAETLKDKLELKGLEETHPVVMKARDQKVAKVIKKLFEKREVRKLLLLVGANHARRTELHERPSLPAMLRTHYKIPSYSISVFGGAIDGEFFEKIVKDKEKEKEEEKKEKEEKIEGVYCPVNTAYLKFLEKMDIERAGNELIAVSASAEFDRNLILPNMQHSLKTARNRLNACPGYEKSFPETNKAWSYTGQPMSFVKEYSAWSQKAENHRTCSSVPGLKRTLFCLSRWEMFSTAGRASVFHEGNGPFKRGEIVDPKNDEFKKLRLNIDGINLSFEQMFSFFDACQGKPECLLTNEESDFLERILRPLQEKYSYVIFGGSSRTKYSASLVSANAHEHFHAIFFEFKEYRERIREYWFREMKDGQRKEVRDLLSKEYDIEGDDEVAEMIAINEFQAYVLMGLAERSLLGPMRELKKYRKDLEKILQETVHKETRAEIRR